MTEKKPFSKTLQVQVEVNGRLCSQFDFESGPLVFGSSQRADIYLDSPSAMPEHCEILEDKNKYYLVHLSSRLRVEIPDDFEFFIDAFKIHVRREERKALAPQPTHHCIVCREPIVEKCFHPDLIELHPQTSEVKNRRLEAVVMWHDQVFEVREFEPQEKVTIGASLLADLHIPTLPRGWYLAHADFDGARCFVPSGKNFSIRHQNQKVRTDDLVKSGKAEIKSNGVHFQMNSLDIVDVDLGSGLKLVLRYIPATTALTKKKLTEPDRALKSALIGSALIHAFVSIIMLILAPKTLNVPKLPDVPERYARLLVTPPKPILPIPPQVQKIKKPEPKKVAKAEPKRKEFKTPKEIKKHNKYPFVVKSNKPAVKDPGASKDIKVESTGALAVLNNMKSASITNNVQIDKSQNTASSKAFNSTGVATSLVTNSGKLLAAGSGALRTGGRSLASGSQYGTPGMAMSAGKRNVAGSVIGKPQLVSGNGRPEGLTRAQVMAVVQKHLGEIQACYEKSLIANPDLAGRMEFEWDIQPAGRVSTVRVKRSTVAGGDLLGECVKAVFKAMQFPKAVNGQSTTPNIGFPFGRL